MTLRELLSAVPTFPPKEAAAAIRAAGRPPDGELDDAAYEAVALARALAAAGTEILTALAVVEKAAGQQYARIGEGRYLAQVDHWIDLTTGLPVDNLPYQAVILTLDIRELGKRLRAIGEKGDAGAGPKT